MKDLTHNGLSQAFQVFLFFKIQDCLFILSFVDKQTNPNWFRLLENWYFLSQEVPEPPCLGIYHSSPPIPSSPGSVTTRLEVSLNYFQFSSWEERLVHRCGNCSPRRTPYMGRQGYTGPRPWGTLHPGWKSTPPILYVSTVYFRQSLFVLLQWKMAAQCSMLKIFK